MKTFHQRFYELFHQFVHDGINEFDASNLAVSVIQHEVRTTGRTYS